jgi:cytochrome c
LAIRIEDFLGKLRGKKLLLTAIIAAGILLSPPSAFAAQMSYKESETLKHGRELAKLNCGRCHSIGLEGKSPMKEAPPFWTLFTRLPVDSIAEMLVKKATPSDGPMPHFTITKKQADDIGIWISWVQPMAHGKRLVEENCARCHGTEPGTKSTHPDAPAFRGLFKRYPVDALEEAFAEGIYTGHPDMPVFKMTNMQLNDVLAYLEQLQE